MKNLENMFKRLQSSFDTEEPQAGHRERFLEKLNTSKNPKNASKDLSNDTSMVFASKNPKDYESRNSGKSWWKPLAVAASIALLCLGAVGLFKGQWTMDQQVAEISPEVSRTENYFAGLIEQQVNELQNENGPETRRIIDDALTQLKKLESDYSQMEKDLVNGGNGKLILKAMITNFRTRIDLLQDVTNEIETIKKLNTNDTETSI